MAASVRALCCLSILAQPVLECVYKCTHNKHLSVLDFKKEQRAKAIAELEAVKAKPLLAKIVKVLRSLCQTYVKLKGKYERLQGDYDRAREGNANLSERLQAVKMENKALRGTVADFERVRRVMGPEQADRILEAAHQQDQDEKERKRAVKQKRDRGTIITKNGR